MKVSPSSLFLHAPDQALPPEGRPVVRVRGRGRYLDFVVDDAAPLPLVEQGLREQIGRYKDRIVGGVVTVHVGRRLLRPKEMARLKRLLEEEYGLHIAEVWCEGEALMEALSERLSLPVNFSPAPRDKPPAPTVVTTAGGTLLVRGTCRSGTAISHQGDVVVLGDVNPGAVISATGDIIVFGTLRGLVHAGAKGDNGAVIVALSMQPVQLRIGEYMAIGYPPEYDHNDAPGPEMARVVGRAIVVEPYTPLMVHRK